MRYDIWQNGQIIQRSILARGAGDITGLGAEQVEWAVETWGRADDEQGRTVVEAGSPDPGPVTGEMIEEWATHR